jgi:hypothetical protein
MSMAHWLDARCRTPSRITCEIKFLIQLFVAGLCAIVPGCGPLPGAPSDIQALTISGYVYEQDTPALGEPKLADVLMTVQQTNQSPRTARSDTVGFYTVSVRAGPVSITATKAGYETRASSFDMSMNTVLNFSLTPSSRGAISGGTRILNGPAPHLASTSTGAMMTRSRNTAVMQPRLSGDNTRRPRRSYRCG